MSGRKSVATDLHQESDAFCSELYVGTRSLPRSRPSLLKTYSYQHSHASSQCVSLATIGATNIPPNHFLTSFHIHPIHPLTASLPPGTVGIQPLPPASLQSPRPPSQPDHAEILHLPPLAIPHLFPCGVNLPNRRKPLPTTQLRFICSIPSVPDPKTILDGTTPGLTSNNNIG